MYAVIIALLVVLCAGLTVANPCSVVSFVRLRVMLIAIACWCTVCALLSSLGMWPTSVVDAAIAGGVACIVAAWLLVVVRQCAAIAKSGAGCMH